MSVAKTSTPIWEQPDFWDRKLTALLYNPPDGALYLDTDLSRRRQAFHEAIRGSRLDNPTPYQKEAELADKIAAAADRFLLNDPAGLNESPLRTNPRINHPFSDYTHQLWNGDVDWDRIASTVDKTVVDILDTYSTSSKAQFLAAWRLLPEILESGVPEIGVGWRYMPVDGRWGDSLWPHASTTSAIAGCDGKPGLLMFNLGGVQDFVTQGRRSQDFWTGSFLMSWFAWSAMRWLAENLGPDALMLPMLRSQPIVDDWLASKISPDSIPPTDDWARSIANLPNFLTAIVPWEYADQIGQQLVDSVKGERDHVFGAVYQTINERGMPTDDSLWEELWNSQRDEFLEENLFWAAVPWNVDESMGVLDAFKQEITGKNDMDRGGPLRETLSTLTEITAVNLPAEVTGVTFPMDSSLAAAALASQKNLRPIAPRTYLSNLGACTLCGSRPAMHSSEQDDVEAHSKAWQEWGTGNTWRGQLRSGERLCAVCLVKRLAYHSYLESKLTLGDFSFPSTASIATAGFKEAVLSKADLTKLVSAFVSEVSQALGSEETSWTLIKNNMPRRLQELAENPVEGGIPDRELVRRFLRIEGSWFYEDSYQVESIKREFGIEPPDDLGTRLDGARAALKNLIEGAHRHSIRRPARYFAILVADGDKAGEWVSGRRNHSYQHAVHPDLLPGNQRGILRMKRPAGPSSQGAFAAALSNFALQTVPDLVECQYGGKLIYAGGDDVVALVPLWNFGARPGQPQHVVELAQWLSTSFRVNVDDNGHWGLGNGVIPSGDGRLADKPTASLSVQIHILHHSEHLSAHIDRANGQLKSYAKKTLGRNALGIEVVKRSGTGQQAGTKWFFKNDDPVGHLVSLLHHLGPESERSISPRLVHEVNEVVSDLEPLLHKGDSFQKLAWAEADRRMNRHINAESDQARREILSDIRQLREALFAMFPNAPGNGDPDDADPSRLLVDLLAVAQFIQREA